MSYTAKEIEEIFERIWQCWGNKAMRNSGLKALTVTLRSGENAELIELACQIYARDHEGSDYQHQLNNFLLNDVWKDMVDGVKNIQQYKHQLETERREALDLIDEWNQTCYAHWCPILERDAKIPMARKALKDEFFKKNYKKGLDKAKKIFQYRAREGHKNFKLILSFRWFCDTSIYKHTVMRLLEGEYGEPESDLVKKYVKHESFTEEELILIKEENKKLLREIFHDERPPEADETNADIGFV